MSKAAKSFDILAISLSVPHHFDSWTKLFSDLFLVNFLDILAELCSFSYMYFITNFYLCQKKECKKYIEIILITVNIYLCTSETSYFREDYDK